MNAPDVEPKRTNWQQNIGDLEAEKLAFLDETGVNIDMTRRYGRAKGKERAYDKAPENTPINTAILSSMDAFAAPFSIPLRIIFLSSSVR